VSRPNIFNFTGLKNENTQIENGIMDQAVKNINLGSYSIIVFIIVIVTAKFSEILAAKEDGGETCH
jgi:hypothetical protein